MFGLSWTGTLSVLFLVYMGNSLWSIIQLCIPPYCPAHLLDSDKCLRSSLYKNKEVPTQASALRLLYFSTLTERPDVEKDLQYLGNTLVKDPNLEYELQVKVPFDKKWLKRNHSMYLAVFSLPYRVGDEEINDQNWNKAIRHKEATYNRIPLTQFHIPEAQTFNLIQDTPTPEKNAKKKSESDRPVRHLRTLLTVSIMSDNINMPTDQIPSELYYLMRRGSSGANKNSYLPIVYIDELSLRIRDLALINATDTVGNVKITYKPISYGKLRLFLQFTAALSSMHGLGFTAKDTDEVKGIFADTNMVLLLVTFSVSAVHLLFDFLAFKNDISFWRSKKTMAGLSRTTVMWRAFSQTVIFLYLCDENTSLLVLIPSGISSLIEIWKVFKALSFTKKDSDNTEAKSTLEYDGTAMRYLSYALYPLVIGGAIYSLIYTPHKSWLSWTIQSTVNGVYAFGFLFMLPQLFVNYKLKSVAHLPWRAFMYKAFNTFIDDLFAFIITMPTAHRVACFRDDIVFLIYLYQRYLYPVDKSRLDMSTMMDEDGEVSANDDKNKKDN